MKTSLYLFLFLLAKVSWAQVFPSVLLFNTWDFKDCSARMEKAIDMGAKTVNIVPTIKFIAPSKNKVEYFCHQRSFCEKMNSEVVAEIENELKECAYVAARKGVDLSFIPHIDDGGGRGIWRNNLKFNPLTNYGGTNYKTSILDPIQRIVKELDESGFDIEIEYAFQGEMGATVFNFPKAYRSILAEYRKQTSNKVKYGLSLNYNSLGGQGYKFRKRRDKRIIQKLFNSLDFLGLSFYHPVEKKLEEHFNFGKKKFLWELKRKGIKLNPEIPLHFSEIGLGGGSVKNDGRTPGKNPEEIGDAPYAGLYSNYNPRTSPWDNSLNNEFRFNFYKNLKIFMDKEEASTMNKVTRAFIWNAASWDVLGIYPGTSGYSDNRLIDILFK
jgi:hypothetical protein